MKLRWFVFTFVGLSLSAQPSGTQERALLDRYCVICHNQKLRTAGLSLDSTSLHVEADKIPEDGATWEKVLGKVKGGFMPPPGMPRPNAHAMNNLVTFVEGAFDRAALAHPNPGRVVLHRLNRAEYANVIRDLLAFNVDAESLLPPDDSNDGFDNMADTLSFSPALLEGYLHAALKISNLAIGDPNISPTVETFRVHGDLSQDVHAEGLPLGTRGGLVARYNFPLDGEYVFKTTLMKSNRGLLRGVETPSELEVTLDGARIHLARMGGKDDEAASNENPPLFALAIEKRFDVRVPVKAGPHTVTVAFIQESSAAKIDMIEPHLRDLDNTQVVIGVPEVNDVSIGGPFNQKGVGDTPSRRRIFTCRPAMARDELPCARNILTTIARRAYRRPLTTAQTKQLMGAYKSGRSKQGTFDGGIRRGLAQILTSPQFLFRFEPDPANIAPDTAYRLGDFELASRLSFFLWSSIPDDELLRLAAARKLGDPVVLEQQVKRMLADRRSDALIRNFVGQWLYLRNLKRIAPDQPLFPDFDDNLRQAFQRETEMFCASIMRGDRSVLELLNANYTFVNERLAKHYGIPGVYGDQFRRVTIDDEDRRGLLGQASILAVTSYANRTSPVLRGKWILTNVLGNPPPPPPPNVPALKENAPGEKLTLKERTLAHRANPACAGCHLPMDPLGFALEGFDAVGRRRTMDGTMHVDASAEFPDGTTVEGAAGLHQKILSRSDRFVNTLTERLMTYAIGRPAGFNDMPAVRSIVRDAARDDDRFSAIVLGIVKSVPFQMKRKAGEESGD
jgi:hypothetical protein